MYVSPSEKISDKKARYRPSVSRTDSRPGTSSPCLCLLTSAPQSAGEKLLAGSTTVPTMAGGEKGKTKLIEYILRSFLRLDGKGNTAGSQQVDQALADRFLGR